MYARQIFCEICALGIGAELSVIVTKRKENMGQMYQDKIYRVAKVLDPNHSFGSATAAVQKARHW